MQETYGYDHVCTDSVRSARGTKNKIRHSHRQINNDISKEFIVLYITLPLVILDS